MDEESAEILSMEEQAICVGFLLSKLLLASAKEEGNEKIAWREEVADQCRKLCEMGARVALRSLLTREINGMKVCNRKVIADFPAEDNLRFWIVISAEIIVKQGGTIQPGMIETSIAEDGEEYSDLPFDPHQEPTQ